MKEAYLQTQVYLVALLGLCCLTGEVKCTNSTSWSNWSSCSHNCNGGIMTRDCISGNCTTQSSQYKSCNNQNCEGVLTDPRDQQCVQEVKKFLPSYSNSDWKASKQDRVGELCELFCVSQTYGIQINPPIKDGTSCTRGDGTKGRCLGKLCAPVGCDGVLGSGQEYDGCHRCPNYSIADVASKEDCKHFQNSLAIDDHDVDLSNGAPISITSFIPINSMSVTIKYTHEMDLLSLADSYHATVLNTVKQFSLDGNIFIVKDNRTLFTAGPLTQALTIILRASGDSSAKPSVSYNYHLLVPASEEQSTVDSNTTYSWTYDEFGACSVTCGAGVSVAHTHCRDSGFPTKIMPDKFCRDSVKPFPIVKKCSREDCPPRWETSDWGVCSTSCGNGTQYRNVKCWKIKKDGSDFYVADSKCSNLPKPVSAKSCNIRPCGTKWKTSDWSSCSRRCGIGIQNRSVLCVDQGQNIVNDLFCLEDGKSKPASIRPCDKGPCYYSWYTSDWSKCSKQCGEGTKTRTVYCSDQNIVPVSDAKCANLSKPSSQQPCHEVSECFTAWITSAWGPCQGPCGNAHQTRSVNCYVFVDLEVENIPGMCNNSTKPASKQSCPEACATWVTGAWSECSASCGQGTKQRTVKCVKEEESSTECDVNTKPLASTSCQTEPCSDCTDDPKMQCQQMKETFGCSHYFVHQNCCKTCTS